jgi:hypothetical protein
MHQSYSRNALRRGPLANLSRQVPGKRANRTSKVLVRNMSGYPTNQELAARPIT